MMQKIDGKIWEIQMYLNKTMSFDEADRAVYPLRWWIYTDRASVTFLKALLSAKTFMIARKLAKGGSVDDCVNRIREYLSA